MTKKTGVLVSGAAVFAISYSLLIQYNNHSIVPESTKLSIAPQLNYQDSISFEHKKPVKDIQKNGNLQKQVKLLKKQFQALQTQTSQLQSDVVEQQYSDFDNESAKKVTEVDDEMLAVAGKSWNEDYSSLLDESLLRGDVDLAWAEEAKISAIEVIGDLPIGSTQGDTTCGSTLCRLEITHSDPGSHDTVVENMMNQDQWNGPFVLIPMESANGNKTLIYLVQEGEDLPIPETKISDYFDSGQS